MDLNELENRRRISDRNAAKAACVEARVAHSRLAAGYAAQIARSHGKRDAS